MRPLLPLEGPFGTVMLLATTVLVIATCSAEPETAADAVERDSSGVSITESFGEHNLVQWAVSDTPLAEVGVGDGVDLFRVTDAAFLADGFAIANAGSHEVTIHEARGRLLGRIGRSGAGPREFGRIAFLSTFRDTLVITDAELRRVVMLTGAGEWVRTVPVDPQTMGNLREAFLIADGSIVMAAERGTPPPDAAVWQVHRGLVSVLRYDAGGSIVDTIGTFPGREVFVAEEFGFPSYLAPPFQKTFLYAVAGDSLLVAPTERAEVQVWTIEGNLRRLVRWRADLGLVDSDISQFRDSQYARYADTPELLERYESLFERMPRPEFGVAFSGMLADPDGNVWLSQYSPPGSVPAGWLIVGADGRPMAEITLPAGLRVLDVTSDRVLGQTIGNDGTERVQVYAIVR